MKSLAHPEWPYEGTSWEWRGFGSDHSWRQVNNEPFEYAIRKGPVGDEFVTLEGGECLKRPTNIYQKLSFGPDLP